jgi:hypothetical protein
MVLQEKVLDPFIFITEYQRGRGGVSWTLLAICGAVATGGFVLVTLEYIISTRWE